LLHQVLEIVYRRRGLLLLLLWLLLLGSLWSRAATTELART
jgi:hypothetical protein